MNVEESNPSFRCPTSKNKTKVQSKKHFETANPKRLEPIILTLQRDYVNIRTRKTHRKASEVNKEKTAFPFQHVKKIVLGTQSPLKLGAVHDAFNAKENGIIIDGCSAPSLVFDQPTGIEETRQGAKNRALGAISRVPLANMWIGIESGKPWHLSHASKERDAYSPRDGANMR